ncbi:hypothetical protein EJB05_29474, partial [Eragrostis curvula]
MVANSDRSNPNLSFADGQSRCELIQRRRICCARERLVRVYVGNADPCEPVYVTIGNDDNREGLARRTTGDLGVPTAEASAQAAGGGEHDTLAVDVGSERRRQKAGDRRPALDHQPRG